ncbi:MAG: DUF7000 family protein [Oscillospiraceae bacterium]
MAENKTLNDYVAVYKKLLAEGEVSVAYERLCKYVAALKAQFAKQTAGQYFCGNVSPGYMDFTYFSFFDEFLRGKKLRFGIVLNHREMRFELWLMGQNRQEQLRYWELLKGTKWNEGRKSMPRYSVLETVLIDTPDFNRLPALTAEITRRAVGAAGEIQAFLESLK